MEKVTAFDIYSRCRDNHTNMIVNMTTCINPVCAFLKDWHWCRHLLESSLLSETQNSHLKPSPIYSLHLSMSANHVCVI